MSNLDQPGAKPASSGSSGLSPKQIAALVAGVLAVIFIFQNTATGRIHFLFMSFEAPVWIFFAVLLLVGAAFGWVFRGRRDKKKAMAL